MKHLYLLVFVLILGQELYAQKTYYGYAPRNIDSGDEYLTNTTLQLSVDSRTIAISLNGKIYSYTSMLGDEVEKDYNGRIVKIGTVDVKYDFSGKVSKVGETEITYSMGKMTTIGKYDVLYDYNGKFKGTKEKVTYSNYRW